MLKKEISLIAEASTGAFLWFLPIPELPQHRAEKCYLHNGPMVNWRWPALELQVKWMNLALNSFERVKLWYGYFRRHDRFNPCEDHANRDKREQKRYKKKSGENVKIFGWTTFNDPQTTQKCRARASEKRVRNIRSCEINLVENSFIVLHIHSPLVLSSSLARSYLFPFVRENIKTQNKRERDERRRETCNTSFERFLSFS